MKRGFTLIELMIVVAIIGILAAVIIPKVADGKYKTQLQRQGYNMADVRVFLNGTGYSYKDLSESMALQKQFRTFQNGESSDFMRNAKVQHASEEAEAAAMMAAAAAASASANSSR